MDLSVHNMDSLDESIDYIPAYSIGIRRVAVDKYILAMGQEQVLEQAAVAA